MAGAHQQQHKFERTRDNLTYLLNQCGILVELLLENDIKPTALIRKTDPDKSLISSLKIKPETRTFKPVADQIFSHLDKLSKRINDKTSKILVTGDLNSGKSTFVNTVLRRQVVPDDQEPCTALFVEVVDVNENDGVEEVHGIQNPAIYSRSDTSTFVKIPLDHLRQHVESDAEHFQLLKVYCRDHRENPKSRSLKAAAGGGSIASKVWSDSAPDASKKWEAVEMLAPPLNSASLLHNGMVDISLIDSPGLNIDTLKTTALFSKQSEIDVIVFLVNAENHFTLSAKEFLKNATREKDYVFVVINRFDSINKKDRNKENILEQIKEISKTTYDDANNLVHFVSAKIAFNYHVHGVTPEEPHWISDFEKLEESLRSFILHKRVKSKLAPAHVFLKNTFKDLRNMIEGNIRTEQENGELIKESINTLESEFTHFKQIKKESFGELDNMIFQVEDVVATSSRRILKEYLKEFELFLESVEWNGILGSWEYSRKLRTVTCKLGTYRISACIELAKAECKTQLQKLQNETEGMAKLSEPSEALSLLTSLENSSNEFLLDLPNQTYFDASDKFYILRDFIPSLLMGVASFLGYRSLSTTNIILKHQSMPTVRIGRLLFAGLAITGCGLLMFKLSDMKQNIKKRISERIHAYFEGSNFIESRVREISLYARRSVQAAAYDLQRQFQLLLDGKENSFLEKLNARQLSEEKTLAYQGLHSRIISLQQELDSITID